MKGVILAGGLGTRLRPLTLITNKHLLPVYDKPMILYPIESLKQAGMKEIMIVCGKEYLDHFMRYLGNGENHGVSLSYAIQNKDNGGIADALACAEEFVAGDSVAMILGDNIFGGDFSNIIEGFETGARVFFQKVHDPERFGVPVFNEDGDVIAVEEKPEKPKSQYAQTGMFLFDNNVFDIIKRQKPSKRGEMEITDVVNAYIKRGELSHTILDGVYFDAGTFDSLLEAGLYMQNKANHVRKSSNMTPKEKTIDHE